MRNGKNIQSRTKAILSCRSGWWEYAFGCRLTHLQRQGRDMRCVIKECKEEAEFDIPAMLCEKHWQMWFDYELEISEHLKTKE